MKNARADLLVTIIETAFEDFCSVNSSDFRRHLLGLLDTNNFMVVDSEEIDAYDMIVDSLPVGAHDMGIHYWCLHENDEPEEI